MAAPELSNMFQAISLTSEGSDSDPCVERQQMEVTDEPQRGGGLHYGLPADTPITPPVLKNGA